MTRIVEIAAQRARMVMAFIILSILAGAFAYVSLPKSGEPDIQVPYLFVSVPFPGISAADAERLLLKPMETQLADIEGLKEMSGTAAENYAGLLLKFDFGWDKTSVIADVRDAMNSVEASFPDGADKYLVNEINFSEFPIIIVNLSGEVPERTLIHLAQKMQDRLESLEGVLEATPAGFRDEMLEVTIDPLRLEAYNVTAGELINVVRNNNQLIAAGAVTTPTGAISVKIPSSFDEVQDVYDLPVKVNGDRVVTLGDLARIRLTFQDRTGTARYNGNTTVALQVVKAKGANLIDTAAQVRAAVAAEAETWPDQLRQSVHVTTSNDQSVVVGSMVRQLEGSVITAIALVMIVVLAALGMRSALLVGFAIPTSFLLTFALFGALDVTISNIVMFGLILAVGMLVDGAIVVVEYADKRIAQGIGPMRAYVMAAKRMFWPIVSSTATTLCAFLPMLFWPGIPGEFMGWLPKTLIYVLSASLLVALIYLPVMGGVAGRMSRALDHASEVLRPLPWLVRAALVAPAGYFVFLSGMQMLNPDYLFSLAGAQGANPLPQAVAVIPGLIMFVAAVSLMTIVMDAAKIKRKPRKVRSGYRRSPFGWFIHIVSGNPVMPVVTIGAVIALVGVVFVTYGKHNLGVEFFAATEPEQAIIYVRARGNLSVEEKDALVRQVEEVAIATPGIESTFSFAGAGGLNQNTGGASGPRDTIGQVQIEMVAWDDRPHISEQTRLFGLIPFTRTFVDPAYDGDTVMANLEQRLNALPAIRYEGLNLSMGPASAKPVHLRLKGDDWDTLTQATELATAHFESTPALADVENSLPLPGIDWELDVDVEKAGRYGTDVATVGGMVQLVTTGLLLDTMRVESSDEEIEIRVRLPEQDRVLSTLDSLKLRTQTGLVPLSNFVSRKPVPTLAQINRTDTKRYFDVKSAVDGDLFSMQAKSSATDSDGNAVDVITRFAVLRKLDDATGHAGGVGEITVGEGSGATRYLVVADLAGLGTTALGQMLNDGTASVGTGQNQTDAPVSVVAITPTERIAALSEWLNTDPFPDGVEWEWTGDNEEQAESMAFLSKAFAGALFLMFIILLAQFNSIYNSVLVLLAVVLSTTGVLVGMLVMGQPFSIIMTGTGVVALAGIVVNNNIVLIDTYQDYSRYMPRLEAITRTAEARIRPVLLTTITTMAGLAPMMFGLSLDFFQGGYSIDAPTALWWKQLATAVVFGLGIATVLTLVFTPSMLALRVWVGAGAYRSVRGLMAMSGGRGNRSARDIALARAARKRPVSDIVWDFAAPDTQDDAAIAEDHEAEADQPAESAIRDVLQDIRPGDDNSAGPADTPQESTEPSPDDGAHDGGGKDGENPIKAAE